MHILTVEAGVPEEVATWIMENDIGPRCECPADYAKLFPAEGVTEGIKVDILAAQQPPISTDGFKGRKIAGRLHTAWDYCCQDHAGEAQRLAAPNPDEDEHAEKPWPEPRKLSCHEAVKAAYGGLALQPDQVPSDLIMNRMDKYWKDKKATLLQLDKMKNQADHELIFAAPPKEKDTGISCGQTSLVMRTGPHSLPEVPLGTVEQVLQAIQTMANGWVLLGTRTVPSKKAKSADSNAEAVREWGITENIAWPAFVRRMVQAARSLGDSESSLVQYARVRERQTRQMACSLWREEGYPWGEAMQKVWTQDMAVFWTVTMQSNAFGLQVSLPGITDVSPEAQGGVRAAKRPRSPPSPRQGPPQRGTKRDNQQPSDRPTSRIPKDLLNVKNEKLEQWMLCYDFNGPGCRAGRPSECPLRRLHRCGFRLKDGTFCGATGHSKADCPSNPRNGGHGSKAKQRSDLVAGRGSWMRSSRKGH